MKWGRRLLQWYGFKVHVVPLERQRYVDVGDWLVRPRGTILVRVADTGSWRYNLLIAVHEMVEAWLCRRHGVAQEAADRWDMRDWPEIVAFAEQHRFTFPPQLQRIVDNCEAGAWPGAPYHREHMAATRVERMLAWCLGVNWVHYNVHLGEMLA